MVSGLPACKYMVHGTEARVIVQGSCESVPNPGEKDGPGPLGGVASEEWFRRRRRRRFDHQSRSSPLRGPSPLGKALL